MPFIETDDDTKSLGGLSTETTGSRQTTPTHRPPVMSLGSGLRDPPPTPTSIGDADCLSLNESGNNRRIVQGSRLTTCQGLFIILYYKKNCIYIKYTICICYSAWSHMSLFKHSKYYYT